MKAMQRGFIYPPAMLCLTRVSSKAAQLSNYDFAADFLQYLA
jgi:hypothetical protein